MALPVMTRILEIWPESRRVRTFVFDLELPTAQPGQFVMLWLPGVDEKPMSIAWPAPLTITVKRLGPFSTALHEASRGERLGVRGPFGRGFSLREDRPALLVGGGYGVPPLYFLAARAVERTIPTTVAVGARRAGELLYLDRFRALGVEPLLATDDGSAGEKGTVLDLLHRRATLYPAPVLYACGPEPMLVALLRFGQEHGLDGQFSVERYMKCGFGICGQCALDGLLVCQDGPVLTGEQLQAARDFGRFRRNATGRKLPVR